MACNSKAFIVLVFPGLGIIFGLMLMRLFDTAGNIQTGTINFWAVPGHEITAKAGSPAHRNPMHRFPTKGPVHPALRLFVFP